MTSGAKRVLLVEDQRLIAAELERTVRRIGYDVIARVASGEEAIEKAVDLRPDLVLMDVRLRGRPDGIQAAAALRERMELPIVYLTAHADDEALQRALVAGPFGCVAEPFDDRELRAAIEIAIYQHSTDRLLAEERARRQAAEELKLLVDGVQDYAIYLVDVDGRVATWNAGAEKIKGYAADEIVGRHVSVFYAAEDVELGKPQADLDAAAETGRVGREAWRLRKDGSRFWANVTTTALRDERGRLRGFGKVLRDVSARRQAELELKESAARLSALVAAALDCIVSIDLDGRVLDWNPAAEQTFGYGRDEAMGRAMADLIVPERLRARHRGGLARYRDTGEGPILGKRLEMPAIDKAGTEKLVELSIVRVPVGGPPIFTGFLRDVTARRAAEVERAKLLQDAQDAIRTRDEFLAIASHELRTPLSALLLQLASLQALARELRIERLDQRLAGKVDKALKNGERLATLIDSLLDVSRIATGRLQLNPEPFDLSELLQEVTERLSEQARRAGSALAVHAEPAIAGTWDRLRIEQVLVNLLSNAIKYGGGKPIDVDLAADADRISLSVRDRGIGISPEDVARIFGRFERAAPSRHYGGLGLGLYITRQIVEAHGGRIGVTSEPGVGSTFVIDLPRRRPDPPANGPGVSA